MKKILHVGPGPDMNGGMKTVIETIINSRLKNEFEFIWIASASLKNKFLCFIKSFFKILRLCVLNYIDIVHIHMSENGSCYRTLIFIFLIKVFNKKVIIHSHGGGFELFYSKLSRLSKKVFRFAFNKVDSIIVLTDGWRDYWSTIVDNNKIIVIPNSVKISNIDKNFNENSSLMVVFLGEIGKNKGIYDLIKAIKIVKENNIDIILSIGGKGEVEKLHKLICEYNLVDCVFFKGWVSGTQKNNLLNESDVLVLPSYYESFGIVLLESMSRKLLTICSNGGHMNEIVQDRINGIVFEAGNVNQLAEILIEVYYNRSLLRIYGESGYQTVVANYSEDIVLDKFKNLYLSL